MNKNFSDVKVPVIGIPAWGWKKKAVSFSLVNKNIHLLNVEGLCFDCSRHIQLLEMFDDNDNMSYIYKNSEYASYKISVNKSKKNIFKTINNYRLLYDDIRKNGVKSAIIITDDGCRLDGSHRVSILYHLKFKKINVNIFTYEKIFDVKKSKKIRRYVKKYRAKMLKKLKYVK